MTLLVAGKMADDLVRMLQRAAQGDPLNPDERPAVIWVAEFCKKIFDDAQAGTGERRVTNFLYPPEVIEEIRRQQGWPAPSSPAGPVPLVQDGQRFEELEGE